MTYKDILELAEVIQQIQRIERTLSLLQDSRAYISVGTVHIEDITTDDVKYFLQDKRNTLRQQLAQEDVLPDSALYVAVPV